MGFLDSLKKLFGGEENTQDSPAVDSAPEETHAEAAPTAAASEEKQEM